MAEPEQKICRSMGEQKICDDLLFEIFLRLPVKSVFKFKCLSNRWNHLLSNGLFRNQYESLRESKKFLPLLGFFRGRFNKDIVSIYIETRDCFIAACLESMSIRSKEIINKIAGYCFAESNGVILCGDGFNTYFVCNPITDQWHELLVTNANPMLAHINYGSVGFSYKEEDNGFSFTVVRIYCTIFTYKETHEMEIYCSDKRYWEKYMLCVADDIFVHQCYGCQVVGSTFFWTGFGLNRCGENVLVAYNYKLGQNKGKMWAWIIQFEDGVLGRYVLGESTQEGRFLCAIYNKGPSLKFYMLKMKLKFYSYYTVVPSSEWVQIIELNTYTSGCLSPRVVIAIHPQNSRFVLMKFGSTIYWHDVELGESRSIWHLQLPLNDDYIGHLVQFYKPRYWPPLLR